MQIQYLTNEQGQKTGVLLDVARYQRLTGQKSPDPDLLFGLSQDELTALANSQLAPTTQSRLDKLLAQQNQHPLTTQETEELDYLLFQVDQLTILKTRARYTLSQPITTA